MCGRYTLTTPADVLAELFELETVPELEGRFNIAPSQPAPVVRASREGPRELALARWGLVPYWADDPAIGSRMINARAETAAKKGAFKWSLKRRRCLVPADGFYEWHTTPAGKQPYLFQLAGGEPFAFAGLWDRWRDAEGTPLETFTILTTEPNCLVADIHDRMPLILPREEHALWLDPDMLDPERLAPLLEPFPAERMEHHPVSQLVNDPANDVPECIHAVAPLEPVQGTLF